MNYIKKKNIFNIIIFNIIIFIIFLIYFLIKKYNNIYERFLYEEEENIKSIYSPIEYKDLLLNNLEKGRLTKLKIRNVDIQRDDCDEKCGEKDCKIMYEQKRNLEECNKCHINPKKCYKKSISGGNCEDCLDSEVQMKCNDVSNFGAPNPYDLFSKNGVEPYFVIKTYFSKNNDISQDCRFSNDLTDLI